MSVSFAADIDIDTATALILRTCATDGKSYGGFQWSLQVGATVTAPDWHADKECGHGLHGALWGEGDGSLLSWSPAAKWLVVETQAANVIDLGGKVKFPSCVVRHVGDKVSATAYLMAHLPARPMPFVIIGGTATAGDRGTATAGDRGTILVRWWDGGRYRFALGYVGENGIKANTPYYVVNGVLVEKKPCR